MKRFLIALCFLFAGCAETPDSFKKAADACAPFGGLKYHYLFPWEQIHCVNGTIFKYIPDAQ